MRPVAAANPLAEDLDHVLRHTSEVWEELRGKSIFVTGGTGFFGRWLLESFAEANRRCALGARMIVLSRDPPAFQSRVPHLSAAAGVEFVQGDVRTLTATDVRAQLDLSAATFDFVIHAATEANTLLNVENPSVMLETVISGTRAVLEFAAATGARRLLLTSSGAVYGRQPRTISHVAEDYSGSPDTTAAQSAYAEGKRAAEVLCACYAQQVRLEPVIARCFSFFGPHQPLETHLATANFIRDALAGGPIRVSGSGADIRSYLYAADLAIWLWVMLVRGQAVRAYNVGSEQPVTIGGWAREIAHELAPSAQVEVARPIASATELSQYVPSTSRAQHELQLRQRISRGEGLSRFRRWREREERLSRN